MKERLEDYVLTLMVILSIFRYDKAQLHTTRVVSADPDVIQTRDLFGLHGNRLKCHWTYLGYDDETFTDTWLGRQSF